MNRTLIFEIWISLQAIVLPPVMNAQQARIMFYNAENLFDPFDDSLTKDEEYTPDAIKHWTYNRFLNKAMNIYRVIAAVGEWEPPVVVGFCEIESRFALEALLERTPLQRVGYRFIHQDSPDPRGIDVAMIYRPEMLAPDSVEFIPVIYGDDGGRTRDVLYVRGMLFGDRQIHLFINHWPSRAGGAESALKRMFVAALLKKKVDSILAADNMASIVALGDFNDEPWDASLKMVAGEPPGAGQAYTGKLVNLSGVGREFENSGTISHGGFWQLFDQVLVSMGLWEGCKGLDLAERKTGIPEEEFILSRGAKWNSARPYRTYLGPFYQGGYSDHLPVFLDVARIPFRK